MILKHLLSKKYMQYNTKAKHMYNTYENSTTHTTENSMHEVAPSSTLQEKGVVDNIQMVERAGSEEYYKCGRS